MLLHLISRTPHIYYTSASASYSLMSYSSHTIYLCSCSAAQPLEPGNTNPELKQHETAGIPLTHQTENPEHNLEPRTMYKAYLEPSHVELQQIESRQIRSAQITPSTPRDIKRFYAYRHTVQADTMRQDLKPNLASSYTLNGAD